MKLFETSYNNYFSMKFKNNYKVIEMLPKSEPFRPNMSKLNESIHTRSLVDATG